MFDVITIGDATFDTIIVIDEATLQCDLNKEHCLLCLNYADKIPIRTTGQSVGGNAANIAVGGRKLGLRTAIVAELGDDLNGLTIQHELNRAGVDIGLIKLLPGQETRFSIILNYQGERTILSRHADRNYRLPKLPPTRWLYYTSLGKNFYPLQQSLSRHLKEHPETKLAVNPGSWQIKNGLPLMKTILRQTEVLFVNKQEAEKLAGQKKNIQDLLSALHRQGVKIAVITDGEKGSYASDRQARYFLPASPVKPLYKTGAGDAYASGFLSALIYKKTLPEAMAWGTANAGGVIQEIGAQKGLLTKTQILRLTKK